MLTLSSIVALLVFRWEFITAVFTTGWVIGILVCIILDMIFTNLFRE